MTGAREAGALNVEPVKVRDAKRRREGAPENLIFRGRVCFRPSKQLTVEGLLQTLTTQGAALLSREFYCDLRF